MSLIVLQQPGRNSKSASSFARTVKNEGTNMKNIFVGNLDFAATESSIRSLFEPYGSVERVNLITDRDTGRSRGFAFVEMADSAEADRAITALNGADVNGRALNVNEARPKADGGGGKSFRGGPRGGGGGPRQRREPRW
jgi:cold-inducible RNA-binding protein